MSKITLEQWRMFAAVVDYGGFAQAAEAVHKSQSTINYAVNKLQEQLGVKLLEVVGRKAVLTETGSILLNRARPLLDDADHLEKLALAMTHGQETVLHLAVDAIFPPDLLFEVLDRFSAVHPFVRIELHEEVLSGGVQLMLDNKVDIVIAGHWHNEKLDTPGESLLQIPMVPVAAPEHELQAYGMNLSKAQLRQHRQIVIRDSGRKNIDAGWLGADQRWTVSHIQTSINMICQGLGYAWLPRPHIEQHLQDGRLKLLAVEDEPLRHGHLFLYQRKAHIGGECTDTLLELFRALSQVYFN